MFDKEIIDTMMKSAGVGAVIGWVIQWRMWQDERNERKEAHAFIIAMLDKVTTEKVNGTNAITTLTTAVNAIIALVRGEHK